MHNIAVIAFEGISPFHLSVPCIVFGDEMLKLGTPRYRLLICGEKAGRVPTMSGFHIEVEHDLGSLANADTVIVPAWRDPDERPPEALLEALNSERGACARRTPGRAVSRNFRAGRSGPARRTPCIDPLGLGE